jgi:hypothetical protein
MAASTLQVGAKAAGVTRAVVVAPIGHLGDRAGAAKIVAGEIAVLAAMGMTVDVAVAAPSVRPLHGGANRRRGEALAQALGASRVAVAGTDWLNPAGLVSLGRAVLSLKWDQAADILLSRSLDPSAVAELAKPPPSIVVVNYLSGAALGDALAPRARQMLVLHDLADGHLPHELASYPHILCLSAVDAARLKAAFPGADIEVGIPLALQGAAAAPAPDAGLDAILRAAGPSRMLGKIAEGATLDLLFVGGRHPPNVAGIKRFLAECFAPLLAPRGVTCVVAGDVCADLAEEAARIPGLICLGRVEDLTLLYAAAKLVIVPLIEGTGVSVKTLEAIAAGKPVVASPVGMRGLGGGADMAVATGSSAPFFGKPWANHIEGLLASPEKQLAWRDKMAGEVSLSSLVARFPDMAGRIAGTPAMAELP